MTLAIFGIVGQLVQRRRIDASQLRVVVQHLLEMRHAPVAVRAVAMKASAQVIANAAACHVVERDGEHFRRRLRLLTVDPIEQEEQVRWLGEFRTPRVGFAVAETAVLHDRIARQAAGQSTCRQVRTYRRERDCRAVAVRCARQRPPCPAVISQLLWVLAPRVWHEGNERQQTRHTRLGCRGRRPD